MVKEERVTERRIIEDDNGRPAQEPAERTEKAQFTAVNLIWYIVGIIEALLALRFVLKLFGANPSSGFVNFIYDFTSIFVAPFRGIFSPPDSRRRYSALGF